MGTKLAETSKSKLVDSKPEIEKIPETESKNFDKEAEYQKYLYLSMEDKSMGFDYLSTQFYLDNNQLLTDYNDEMKEIASSVSDIYLLDYANGGMKQLFFTTLDKK